MKILNQSLLVLLVILTSALTAFAVLQLAPQPVLAANSMTPTAKYTVLNVNCLTLFGYSDSFTKIGDLGTFQVANPDSVIEATFYGRVSAFSVGDSVGARFELRVDDLPTNLGRARAVLRTGEYVPSHGMPMNMSGVFTGLSAGTHTVSLWVQSYPTGGGDLAQVDPGCWSSDHVVVRESLPFGVTYLPNIVK